MSLYIKSKEVLYKDFIKKVFPSEESELKNSLLNLKLEDIKQLVEKKNILENFIDVLSHKNLFMKYSNNLYEAFSIKASMLLSELPIRVIDVFAANISKSEIFPIFTKKWVRRINKKIVVNKETLTQMQQVERLGEKKVDTFFKLLSPLTDSVWRKPRVIWLPYIGNYHLAIIIEMPLTYSADNTAFTLLKTILQPAFSEEVTNFVEESFLNEDDTESYITGSKHFFNFEREKNLEEHVGKLLNSFGYDSLIFLEKNDVNFPVYRPSSLILFEEEINTDASFALEDLLEQVGRQHLLKILINGKSQYRVHQCLFLDEEKSCALLLQNKSKKTNAELINLEIRQLPLLKALLRHTFNK